LRFFSPMTLSTTSIRSRPLTVAFQASWTDAKACLRPAASGVRRLAASCTGVHPTFGSQSRGSAPKRGALRGQEPAKRPTAKAAAAAAAAKSRRGLERKRREEVEEKGMSFMKGKRDKTTSEVNCFPPQWRARSLSFFILFRVASSLAVNSLSLSLC